MKVEERRTLGVHYGLAELRAEASEDGEGRRLIGHAAVFDVLSKPIFNMFREVILPGAFRDVISDKGTDTLALINHDVNQLLARTGAGTLRLTEDYRGLLADVPKVPALSFAEDLLVNVEAGNIRSMSFGFIVGEDGEKWYPEGEKDDLPVREVSKVERLIDVSYVANPAYDDTDVVKRSYEAWRQGADAWQFEVQARARQLQLIGLRG